MDSLKYKLKNEENKNVKEVLRKRLANLEGKTAIVAVGGHTEVEMGENRDKIIDCLNSCKSALENGILPGGGTAFIHSLKVLENHHNQLKKSNEISIDKNSSSFNNRYDYIVGIEVFIKAVKVIYWIDFF